MFDKRQVIVVGAGPSGSATAFYLAKAGVDVLMIDRETWPRDKACGDGQTMVVDMYKEMGVFEEVCKVGYPLRGSRFSGVKEEMAVFAGPMPKEPGGFATPRRIIDDITRRAALNAGADWLENCEAIEVIRERGYAKGVRAIYKGKLIDIRADAVVLADGGHSTLGRQFGFFNDDPEMVFMGARGYFENVNGLLENVIEEHYPAKIFYPGGYMWVFTMGPNIANIGVFITEKNLRDGKMRLEDYFDWWRDNTKIGKERLGEARLLGEIKGWRLPTSKEVGKVHGNGILAVGDAGSHIQCYSGGGYDTGMKSGRAAAKALVMAIEKDDFSKESLSVYEKFDAEENNFMLKFCYSFRKEVCPDPETYEEFLDFARELEGYPNNNQYAAYVAFMMMHKEVDLMEDYGVDLEEHIKRYEATGEQSSGGH
ncbi:MAG: NAD(P)/FAD-dependent oxidoreductase [Clostridiales bacterium]|nr:NAD(P)/FAD-dependent oxidoreductase [Clostridiales bacterium]